VHICTYGENAAPVNQQLIISCMNALATVESISQTEKSSKVSLFHGLICIEHLWPLETVLIKGVALWWEWPLTGAPL